MKVLIIITLSFMNICSIDLPNYYEPWQPGYCKQFEDIRIQVAAHGLLAPNAHNTQPWIIKLFEPFEGSKPSEGLTFELYTDSERLLPETDPPARQITISQGTFLEASKIAANHLGYEFNMELFPNGEYGDINFESDMQDKPVARVSLTESFAKVSKIPKVDPMYNEIFQRVTNRTAYYGESLNGEEMAVLQTLNDYPNLSLVFFNDTESLEKIRRLTIKAVEVEATTEFKVMETERLFRDSEKEKKAYRDGITMMSGGLSGFKLKAVQFFSSMFPLSWEKIGQIWIKSETRNIQTAPTFAMIISEDNSRTTQVETGMLYTRFQLKASSMGISMQPLSQSLQEFPEMSDLYKQVHNDFADNDQTIQMLVRMGRADEVLHSPRRDVMDIIIQ